MSPQKAIIVAISGCSSSGKTTLARLLRDIFPNTFILHQDDFYRPESELPTKYGLLDWDCPEALDLPLLKKALLHIRSTGTFPVSSSTSSCSSSSNLSPPLPPLPSSSRRSSHGCVFPPLSLPLLPPPPPPPPPPPRSNSSSYSPPPSPQWSIVPDNEKNNTDNNKKQDFISSIEDLNTVGALPQGITPDLISSLKSSLPSAVNNNNNNDDDGKSSIPICILDGFLLYTRSDPILHSEILPLLDVKLFLLATKEAALERRQNRDGYVTLEGFWTDPPGYVEKIVWPNYVEHHKWLFQGEDVEAGVVDEEVVRREHISVQPRGPEKVEFKEVLEWAVGEVVRGVNEWVGAREKGEREKERERNKERDE